MRPTINQSAQTIDAVISKLKNSHIQFIELLIEQINTAGTPPSALKPLETLRNSALKREPIWFNTASNYLTATKNALNAKEEIFEMIALSDHWGGSQTARAPLRRSLSSGSAVGRRMSEGGASVVDSVGDESEVPTIKAEKMFICAQMCAAEGKVTQAIEMLALSLQMCPRREGPLLHPVRVQAHGTAARAQARAFACRHASPYALSLRGPSLCGGLFPACDPSP